MCSGLLVLGKLVDLTFDLSQAPFCFFLCAENGFNFVKDLITVLGEGCVFHTFDVNVVLQALKHVHRGKGLGDF